MTPHVLLQLDSKTVPDTPGELRVFLTVRDEMIRLPGFFKYYRDQGVDRFIVVDNGSTDGTTAYLLQQPDVHVFGTTDSFAAARSGINWMNALTDRYGTGYWCLRVDADELLVYPHCERKNLKAFCAFLEAEGSEGIFTFMLDMYPQGSVKDAVCKPDSNFFDVCPCFDKDYRFVDRIHMRGDEPFPRQEVLGGPRTRCFYPDQLNITDAQRKRIHIIRRIIHHLRKRHIPVPQFSIQAPALFKIPLVKWSKGMAYTASTHQIGRLKLSPVTGVLAHFKFFSDFHARAVKAVAENEHAEGASEYKRYLARGELSGSLAYAGTQHYTGSASVLSSGLIKTSDSWDKAAV